MHGKMLRKIVKGLKCRAKLKARKQNIQVPKREKKAHILKVSQNEIPIVRCKPKNWGFEAYNRT